ncbi:hypothetical protein [Nitrososphaera sp.]|uniref:hypothetical protein n=1 Tax=Nitrososphaera sp. TaxID=1971748 RepID=UPI001851FC82|nr:hypothetical protein [Nitrososphaera sp.]NWG37823.1 hypothetical protein [Nitrososphaera sp.]
MGDLTIRLSRNLLSDDDIRQIHRLRKFADGKNRSLEEFTADVLKEHIDTLLNNPERLERGLRKLMT